MNGPYKNDLLNRVYQIKMSLKWDDSLDADQKSELRKELSNIKSSNEDKAN